VPRNIKDQFHDWEKELLGASMVNIHSKVIVLDPFGVNPVVMTGSHNLGGRLLWSRFRSHCSQSELELTTSAETDQR
jgi:hypothetical protein